MFQSPKDHLDIDTLDKTLAYAYLYKVHEKMLQEISKKDITVSIIRETKPLELFPFPVQIIVTGELDRKSHTWLTALSGGLGKDDIRNLLNKVNQIKGKNDRAMADSVLEVSVRANRRIIEELMGDDVMLETLMEIMEPKIMEAMEPKIDEARKESRREGLQEGLQKGTRKGRIQGTIGTLRNLHYKDEDIKSEIMKQFGLTEDEADGYLQP